MLHPLGPARRAGISAFALAFILLAGCDGSDVTDPGATQAERPSLDSTRRLPTSGDLIVTPDAVTAQRGQKVHFAAYSTANRGDSIPVTVEWSATGGSITSTGDFTASASGTYTVIGKTKGRWKRADSSVVVIPPTQLRPVRMSISPTATTLAPGAKRTFSLVEVMSDSSTTPAPVTWTATGGRVDTQGAYTAGSTAGTYWVAAMDSSSGLTDTATVTIDPAPPAPVTLQGITLTPASTSVQTGGTKTFSVAGHMSDGSTAAVPVNFSATGGTITAAGGYTAGTSTGSFRVIARDTSGTFADTAAVTITAPAPTLTAIVLSPGSASVQTAGTQQFAASGKMSDGSTTTVTVTFAATGGTVSSGGLYTAGQSAGTYRVIATQSGGSLADTAAVTVTAPSPPPPPPSGTCDGVTVAAGASIQSAVNANGTGTTFCLSSGTYTQQSISPKAGQKFIGARGSNGARLTVLDGQNVTQYAFNSSAGNVVIQGLVVRNYATPQQQSAVFGYNGTGWQVLDNELTANAAAGTNAATNWIVRGNYIHHNGQLGVHPQSNTSGAVVDSNEISYNNTAGFDPNWEAGGIKGILTTNLTIRGNWVHHNSGYGIWCDNCSATTRYEGNVVEDNSYAGIYHEVSADAVIIDNTCRRNGVNTSRGGIWVDNSANVEVTGNVLDGNGDGIKLRQVSRPDLPNRVLQNGWVHDNTVTLTKGTVGVVQYVSDNSFFSSKNIRFSGNHYTLTPSAPFAWNNSNLTLSQWNAAGMQ